MLIFIVLHYQSFDMTVECIETLVSTFGHQNCKVLVVDNGSTNNSGVMLKEKYKEHYFVEIIRIEKNKGFANGNNYGYRYAKEHFNPNFIVLLSNDVIISDNEAIDKIKKIYNETRFSVMGPDILSKKTGLHQNPVSPKGLSKSTMVKSVLWRTALYPVYCFRTYIRTLKYNNSVHVQSNDYYVSRKENYVMYGACYIYSKDFIEKEKFALNPDTYLYMEEWILHYYCVTRNHKLLYDPSLTVYHYEDVDTDKKNTKLFKKSLMVSRESLKSSYILLRLMNEK